MLGGADPLVKLLELHLNLGDAPEPLGTSPLEGKEEHSANAWMLFGLSLIWRVILKQTPAQLLFKSKIIQLFYTDSISVFAKESVINAPECHLFKDMSISLVK